MFLTFHLKRRTENYYCAMASLLSVTYYKMQIDDEEARKQWNQLNIERKKKEITRNKIELQIHVCAISKAKNHTKHRSKTFQ